MQVDYSPATPRPRLSPREYMALWTAWLAVPALGLLCAAAFPWIAGTFTISASVAGIVVVAVAMCPARWPRRMRMALPIIAVLLTASLTPSVVLSWRGLGHRESPADEARHERAIRFEILFSFGQYLDDYANDHQGHYPPTFKALQGEWFTEQWPGPFARIAINGISVDKKAKSFDDPTSPYGIFVYVGGYLTKDSPGSSVAIYERLQPNGDGINVLHRDGTVTWLNKDAAKQLIASYANYKPPATQP